MNGSKIDEALLEFRKRLESLQKSDNFYDYEKQYVQLWQEAGRQVFEASISDNLQVKKVKKNDENTVGGYRDTHESSI